VNFDPADPRGSGRADVGLRCISAALFRSQGLRHSTQVCLSFEASGHTLEVSGATARGLVPDQDRLALRVRTGLDSLLSDSCKAPDPAKDPEAWSKHDLRGFQVRKRPTLKMLKAVLQAKEVRDLHQGHGRIVMIVLTAEGMPVAEACRQIRNGPALAGIVTVVGDHRGSTDDQISAYCGVAEEVGAEVLHVSLGGDTLLASHAIVILTHYFDEMMHRCEVAQQVDYGRGSGR